MVGTGRFELPTPRTPSECSTRLSHVPTGRKPAASFQPQRMGLTQAFYTSKRTLRRFAPRGRAGTPALHEYGVHRQTLPGLLPFSLWSSLRFFFEHGELNLLFDRIDAIHEHAYLLAQAVDLTVALADDLASV